MQAAAGIAASQMLQRGFSCLCHAIRGQHFPQSQFIRRQLFIAEHPIGMTKNRAIFGAEFAEKLFQLFRANLPVNGLLRRKGTLVKQPGKRIIISIFASDLG